MKGQGHPTKPTDPAPIASTGAAFHRGQPYTCIGHIPRGAFLLDGVKDFFFQCYLLSARYQYHPTIGRAHRVPQLWH